jgi:hypothetical protein
MKPEDIKNDILLRLNIERDVRETLRRQQNEESAPVKKSSYAWLDSKFGLLLVGAVISGILVPTFQFTQEEIKWQRQNRYNALDRQLGNIRDSLKQFIAVQALSAELYDLGLAVLDARSAGVDGPQLEHWRKDFRALQSRRLQQNATFAATVFYFPTESQQPIRTAWNELISPSQQLQTLVGNLLEENRAALGKKVALGKIGNPNEAAAQLDTSVTKVNQVYEQVLLMLRHQLIEVERETFKFQ